MKNNNFFNRKYLKSFRSSLRNKSTSAEAVLWNILKSKNLNGRKFRRQHSIGNYIVDFYCASEKLVIELDGNPHGEYHNQPPRPGKGFLYCDNNGGPATPPSKGGESYKAYNH